MSLPKKITLEWCLKNTDRALGIEDEPPQETGVKMPFGKFKGTLLTEIPAYYYNWLWLNGKKDDKRCMVARYIRENLITLKNEYKGGW